MITYITAVGSFRNLIFATFQSGAILESVARVTQEQKATEGGGQDKFQNKTNCASIVLISKRAETRGLIIDIQSRPYVFKCAYNTRARTNLTRLPISEISRARSGATSK